jgi:DNA-nicking Smr family endonuclease
MFGRWRKRGAAADRKNQRPIRSDGDHGADDRRHDDRRDDDDDSPDRRDDNSPDRRDDNPTSAPALTDELDLHTFQPRECADLVDEYLLAAQEAGMTAVRIIHGKGTGTLRRIVHGVLDRHPSVASYRLGDATGGGWGATLVELRPAADTKLEP